MFGIALTVSAAAVTHRAAVKRTAKTKLIRSEVRMSTTNNFDALKLKTNVSPAKAPKASGAVTSMGYSVPQGTLFYSISNDYYGYSNTIAFASPYSNWMFANTATSTGTPSYSWLLNQYDGASQSYSPTAIPLNTTDNNLSLNVTTESFELPTLTASENSVDTSFVFGENYAAKTSNYNATIDAGGSAYDNGTRVYNFTNCFRDLDQITWKFKADTVGKVITQNYAFGTNSSKIDAVVAYYEKPQSTLYFEGANFFLGAYTAPAGTSFTLRIITVDTLGGDLTMKDTIATSYLPSDSVLTLGATAFTMPFKKLIAIDADGLESEVPYLEVDEAFVLELSWTNTPGLVLGVRSSYYDGAVDGPSDYYDSHAYFYAPYAPNNNERTLLNYNWSATLYTSLTNAAYTYLVSETDTIVAEATGSNSTVTLVPYYGGVWVDDTALPAWITYAETEHYESGNWGTDYALSFAALPEGTVGRTADITFYTWGAKKTVHIKQGVVSAVKNVQANNIKAFATQNGFDLTYPANFKTVRMYNIAGQSVGKYALSPSGKSIVNCTLKAGSYILKFEGSQTATVKVLK